MKLAYIENPFDHSKISVGGISKYIIKALKNNKVNVQEVELNKRPFLYYLYAVKQKLLSYLGIKYHALRAPCLWKVISKKMAQNIDNDVDGILSFGSLPVSFLETEKPVYFWTDAVFESLINYYPDYTGLNNTTLKDGHTSDEAAFKRCTKAFLCTHIEITQAKNYYSYADKIFYAPFGGNLDYEPNKTEVEKIISAKKLDVIKFLLIGWGWDRKGGDRAAELVKHLNDNGHHAELHIIGQEQRDDIKDKNIIFHGRLNKAIHKEKEKFEQLISEATFLVLFSKAETYGHVLCEANAFGLPAITSDTGGIVEVIEDGKNGYKFSNDIPIDEVAKKILEITSDKEQYSQLCLSSYKEYKARLNWDTAVKIVIDEIKNC